MNTEFIQAIEELESFDGQYLILYPRWVEPVMISCTFRSYTRALFSSR